MIGITERGDAGLDLSWKHWVNAGNPAILITKAPGKLLKVIDQKSNIIVHCTITGYGDTIVEPNVLAWEEEIKNYLKLVEMLGKDRVVLRIDPIMPTKIGVIAPLLVFSNACTRVRISFIDMYEHVKQRLMLVGFNDFWDGIHAPLEKRKEIAKQFQGAEICGEPGFECTGCVSSIDCEVLGVEPVLTKSFQRQACACLSLKKELLSTKCQCEHKCLYCYWK